MVFLRTIGLEAASKDALRGQGGGRVYGDSATKTRKWEHQERTVN